MDTNTKCMTGFNAKHNHNNAHKNKHMIVYNGIFGLAALILITIAYVKYPDKLMSEIKELSMTMLMIMPVVILGLILSAAIAIFALKGFMKKWIDSEDNIKKKIVTILVSMIIHGEPLVGFPLIMGVKDAGAKEDELIRFINSWKILTISRWPEIVAFLGPVIIVIYAISNLLMIFSASIIAKSSIITKLKKQIDFVK